MYRIASLNVWIDHDSPTLQRQGKPYESADTVSPDITIRQPAVLGTQTGANASTLDLSYIWTGARFYQELIEHDGLVIHAAGLACDGRAFLFSGACGIGKSTHATLWRKTFGNRVIVINEDKPAVRFKDGCYQVCGTPFSGKTDSSRNICVPLLAICFLEQAPVSRIRRLSAGEALPRLMAQTIRPADPDRMDWLLETVDRLLGCIPVFLLEATPDETAVELAYQTLMMDMIDSGGNADED
jgi:hypothetical protein